MGLLDKLQALGCQLKLVQMVSKTQTTPEKIETRSVTLQELTTEVEAEHVRVLAESPIELTIAFEKIFEAAGIHPAGPWTIERLNELIASPPYNTMNSELLLKAVMEKLAAEHVASEDLVKDALAKDQALDAFENFACQKTKERSQARKKRLSEIVKQIESLQREKEKLQQEDQHEHSQLSQWQQRKQAFEKRLTESVDLLMTCNHPNCTGNK